MERFFSPISKEERARAAAEECNALSAGLNDFKRQKREQEKSKQAGLKTRKRKNQQDHRERSKQVEIQLGVRSPEGKRLPTPKETLHPPVIHTTPRSPNQALKSTLIRFGFAAATRPASTAQLRPPPSRRDKEQKNHNWFCPTVWPDIEEAAKRVGFSSRRISADLQLRNPGGKFTALKWTTVQNWLTTGPNPHWSEKTLVKIEKGVGWIPGEGRIRVLDNSEFSYLKEEFIEALKGMRQATLPVNAFIARNLLLGFIKSRAPHLLLDSNMLEKAEALTVHSVRRFLRITLNWRIRVATQAGQKLPLDWETQCEMTFFRIVLAVARENIHASLLINLDQTGMNVIPGGNLRTYDVKGARQVSLLGKEEKRGFTAVLGVTGDGQMLGVQSTWKGKTSASLPAQALRVAAKTQELGLTFVLNPRNHWSCLETMKQLILEVIAPHRTAMIKKHKLSCTAKVILYLDCWKVHKGEPFRTWIFKEIPWAIIIFVPAGCTGIFQPVDVGIGRVFKHIVRQAAAEYFTAEVEAQLASGRSPADVRINASLPSLRNASVDWISRAVSHFRGEGNALCWKAWSNCKIKQWNLSWVTITSPEARAALLAKDDSYQAIIRGNQTIDFKATLQPELQPRKQRRNRRVQKALEDRMNERDPEDDVDTPLGVVTKFTEIQAAQHLVDNLPARNPLNAESFVRARYRLRSFIQQNEASVPEAYRYSLRTQTTSALFYKEDTTEVEESFDEESGSSEESEGSGSDQDRD